MGYESIAGLSDYYLEDSYVERIVQDSVSLTFHLIVVLCESHQEYSEPLKGEQYCYRKARLVFNRMTNCRWISLDTTPTKDAEGSVDFGNIYSIKKDQDQYDVSGDWGEVIVVSSPPEVLLDEQ